MLIHSVIKSLLFIGKSRGKRGSTSSRLVNSSSESLTSQSSEGHSERTRAISSSTPEGDTSRRRHSPQPDNDLLKAKSTSLDDSYVLYSPATSRDPSPQLGPVVLDKVSSPVRADDRTNAPPIWADDKNNPPPLRADDRTNAPPLRGDDKTNAPLLGATASQGKHEYVNVDYDESKPHQPDVRLKEPRPQNTQSIGGTRSSPVIGSNQSMGGTRSSPVIGSNQSAVGIRSSPVIGSNQSAAGTRSSPVIGSNQSIGGTRSSSVIGSNQSAAGTRSSPVIGSSQSAVGTRSSPVICSNQSAVGTRSSPVIGSNQSAAGNSIGSSHSASGSQIKLGSPSMPCPPAPHQTSTGSSYQNSRARPTNQSNPRKSDTSDEPDYLVISPVATAKQITPETTSSPKQLMSSSRQLTPEITSSPVANKETKEKDYIMLAGGATSPQSGIMLAGGATSPLSGTAANLESDYMDYEPTTGCQGGARPRPRLPPMPVPLPRLEAVVSPIRDTMSGEDVTDVSVTMVTPLPSSEVDEYIEIGHPRESSDSATSSAIINSVPMATVDRCQETPPSPCDAITQQRPLSAEVLSTSKWSLSGAAGGSDVNYATLDLQSVGGDDSNQGNGEGSPRRPKHASGGSSGGSDSADDAPLQYAQIDFKKSEELLRESESEKKMTRPPFDI